MRGRLPDPIELVLAPELTPAVVMEAVGASPDELVAPATVDRVYLDTFDRRLEATGLTGERATPGEVTVRQSGRLVGSSRLLADGGERVFATDVEPGPVRDRLAAVTKERALLPQARVRSRLTPAVIRNPDGKVVVRLQFEAATVLRAGRSGIHRPTRVQLTAVLGYPADFERAAARLAAVPGLAPASVSVAVDAVDVTPDAPIGPPRTLPTWEPGTRAAVATLALCRHLADTVEINLGGTLADLDTEFLHDLRVAIRRSRSVLREMRDVLAEEPRQAARRDLRWIQSITGPTRDRDVQLLAWESTVATHDPSVAADLEPLRALLGRKRQQAWRAMCRQLRGRRFEVAWGDWRKYLDNAASLDADSVGPAAEAPIAEVAGRRVDAVYRRILRDGTAIEADTPAPALHDLRKRGKELRYLLELFGSAWPATSVKALVRATKDLQDVLGAFQDREVEADYLRSLGPELATGPGGPDALIALGLHLDHLRTEQAAARVAFAESFARFGSRPHREVVRDAFRHATG